MQSGTRRGVFHSSDFVTYRLDGFYYYYCRTFLRYAHVRTSDDTRVFTHTPNARTKRVNKQRKRYAESDGGFGSTHNIRILAKSFKIYHVIPRFRRIAVIADLTYRRDVCRRSRRSRLLFERRCGKNPIVNKSQSRVDRRGQV